MGGISIPNVEEHIKEYIKHRVEETQDGIRVPLSRIANDLDYPTVTVWRAVQKLKGKRIIKVVKSHNKAEPDKMYYVGEEDSIDDAIDQVIEKVNGILLTLHELKDRVREKEDAVFELTKRKD